MESMKGMFLSCKIDPEIQTVVSQEFQKENRENVGKAMFDIIVANNFPQLKEEHSKLISCNIISIQNNREKRP